MNSSDPLSFASPQSMPVPSSYAEKAMASLMQLHGELMDEKERRVDLYRRLMEKEQALAELKMYVKLLEERAQGGGDFVRSPLRSETAPAPRVDTAGSENASWTVPPPPRVPPVVPPAPPRPGSREAWKVW